jgi:PII-like signaling protein
MHGFQVTFFTEENRRHGHKPMHRWLMDIAKSLDIKGLTTMVGVEGVGRDGRLHSAHFIEMSDQPVEVTMAVTNAQCAALLELLEKNQANIFYVKTAVEFGVVGSPTG